MEISKLQEILRSYNFSVIVPLHPCMSIDITIALSCGDGAGPANIWTISSVFWCALRHLPLSLPLSLKKKLTPIFSNF